MPSRVDAAKSENAIPVHLLYWLGAGLSKNTSAASGQIRRPDLAANRFGILPMQKLSDLLAHKSISILKESNRKWRSIRVIGWTAQTTWGAKPFPRQKDKDRGKSRALGATTLGPKKRTRTTHEQERIGRWFGNGLSLVEIGNLGGGKGSVVNH